MIKLTDVSIKIDQKLILKDVNFQFESKTIYRLIGENGSGKTSLLEAILGLNQFANGHIDSAGAVISYLPQVAHQNPKMQIKLKDLCQQEFSFYQKELFCKNWHQASGGERKKTLIARVLSRNADVYILDEPFNHLDQKSINLVIETIVAYKNSGKLIIYTGHEHNIHGEKIVEVDQWK